MKSLTTLIATLFFLSPIAWADKTITVGVEGMTCQSCVNSVTNAFKKAGYENVVVSLENKNATLTLKDDQKVDEKKISTVIESVGFEAGKVQTK